uniref:Uncharacterized protein n=1 Tax=Sus scrofa TaxID=9823 RepID=A0A8D1KSA1_PIG
VRWLFEEMLKRLQQRWRGALAWVQERAAACFRGLCRALEAFWSLVQSFCSSMGHAFGSVIQVRSLPLLSGLTIRRCCELWCKLQTWLGSRVAVSLE